MAWWKKEKTVPEPSASLGMKPGGVAYPDVNRIAAKLPRSGTGAGGKEVPLSRQELLSQLLETCLGTKLPPCEGPVEVEGNWFDYTCHAGTQRPMLGLFLPCSKCSGLVHVFTVQVELDRANDATWRKACLANSWFLSNDLKTGELHPSALELKNIILRKQSREEIAKYLNNNKYFSVVTICEKCKMIL